VVRAPVGRIAASARAAGLQPPSTLVVGEVVDVLSGLAGVSPGEHLSARGVFAASV